MAGRLGIHVLGPRFGESIVLELPDGSVGVIDSFASSAGPHPVIEFLAKTFPGLSGLHFFALTHPHADHCFRAAEILKRYPPQEFWVFHPFPAGQIIPYYKELAKHKGRDQVEAALELPAGSVALSLLQLWDQVRQPVIDGSMRFRPLTQTQPVARLCEGKLRVHFLTPTANRGFAYADELERASQRILDDGPALRAADSLPQVDHNRASGAVLIQYGSTRALLMADAEAPRWEEWLTTNSAPELCQPVHFIKASHHGSANGYCAPLYAACADLATTIAVMTPFNSGSVALPTSAGALAVRGGVKELYCTNRGMARLSTNLDWQSVNPPFTTKPPLRWVAMIARTPALARLLVASGPPTEPLPALPKTWAWDAARKPELLRLLQPEVRPCATPEPSGLACTVSAYFNNQGTLVDLRVGDDAGRLA